MLDDAKKEELLKSMVYDNEITLTDMIDFIIKENGIIGVGLITLGDNVSEYIKSKIKVRGE